MRRVRYYKAAALVAIICIPILMVLAKNYLARQDERVVLPVMDTHVSITAYGVHAKEALTAAEARLQELEGLWSVTIPESDISAVNHSNGSPAAVSAETAEIMAFALDMARKTKGAFEPTIYPVLAAWGFTTGDYRIPSDEELNRLLQFVGYERVELDGVSLTVPKGVQLDLGAVGKGFASDIIAGLMKDCGVSSAIIDMGGNILTIGAKPGGGPWLIGIKDPFGNGNIGVVEIEALSVVTSGGYERYFTGPDGQIYWHIIDPASGKPAKSGLGSVTVIGSQSAACDALSTAFFVMGQSAAEAFWREYRDFEMILVDDRGGIYITEGLEQSFTLSESHKVAELNVIRP